MGRRNQIKANKDMDISSENGYKNLFETDSIQKWDAQTTLFIYNIWRMRFVFENRKFRQD